jgi:hypothetical protein
VLQGFRERLTYANVVSTVALVLVLAGGTAVAGSLVGKNDIKDNAVRSHHIKDGEVDGDDVDETTFDFSELPAGGGFAAQIRNIGVGGDTKYGAVSGTTTADPDVSLFYQHVPLGATVDGLYVHTRNELAAGQSRTFTLLGYPDVEDGGEFVILSCTIDGDDSPIARDNCQDDSPATQINGAYAIRIVSTGAGIAAGDDAYIGTAFKAPVTPN